VATTQRVVMADAAAKTPRSAIGVGLIRWFISVLATNVDDGRTVRRRPRFSP
jgi:hypothetical protein